MADKCMQKRKLAIIAIRDKIKVNKGSTLAEIVGKLTCEEPFMARDNAIKTLEDMRNAHIIEIDSEDKVTLCQ